MALMAEPTPAVLLAHLLDTDGGRSVFALLLQYGLDAWAHDAPLALISDQIRWTNTYVFRYRSKSYAQAFGAVLDTRQCNVLLEISSDNAGDALDGRFCECVKDSKTPASKTLMERLALSPEVTQLLLPLAIVAETVNEDNTYGERKELQMLMSIMVAHMNMHSVESIVTLYLEARALVVKDVSYARSFNALETGVLKSLLHEIPMWRIIDLGKGGVRIVPMHHTTLDYNFPRFFIYTSLAQDLVTALPVEDLLKVDGYFGRLGRAVAANGLRDKIEHTLASREAGQMAVRVFKRRANKRDVDEDDVRGLKRLLEPDMDDEQHRLDALVTLKRGLEIK